MTARKMTFKAAVVLLAGSGGLAAEGLLDRYDADGNGMIGPDEFSLSAEVFSAYDTDQDGTVTPDEFAVGEFVRGAVDLADLLPAQDGSPGPDLSDPGFGAYDTDGSGGISEDEFQEAELRRFDVDADGALDQAEFGAYRASAGTLHMGGTAPSDISPVPGAAQD